MPTTLDVIDFGLSDYEIVYAQQKDLVVKRLADEIPDTLLIGQHPPVITTGRGTHAENLHAPTLPVVEIERGGDVTYHGPGQLVAYPICRLEGSRRDLHAYLRFLEDVLITTLEDYHVTGSRREGMTGVWVKDAQDQWRKIASIGVAVKQWVTYHGIALNVTADLSHFQQINPCGFDSGVMINLNDCSPKSAVFSEVQNNFCRVFQTLWLMLR